MGNAGFISSTVVFLGLGYSSGIVIGEITMANNPEPSIRIFLGLAQGIKNFRGFGACWVEGCVVRVLYVFSGSKV